MTIRVSLQHHTNRTASVPYIILDLRVRNHPGAMSHITGLFARRAFNLEAIRCAPIGDGTESRMFLLVAATPRFEQINRQLSKLHDVLDVKHREDLTESFFQSH